MASFTFAAVREWLGYPSAAPANDPGPIREASPASDGAQPALNQMVTTTPDAWIPGVYRNAIKTNDDTILRREGGNGLKLFDALLDDEVAFATLQQRRLAITAKDWEVSPGDPDDPRSVQAAEDFRAMLKGVGFDRVTNGLHFAIWYGFAIGEAMWTTKVHDGRTIVWLADIIIPDRRWFGFTYEGELRLTSSLLGSFDGEVLPDNKFVCVRTGGTHDFAYYGTGLAHWCYWPIFFKRAAMRFWALYLEKLGQPTVGIEFPAEEAGTDPESTLKRQSRLQAAAAVGKDTAVLVPAGTLDKGMKILESARSSTGGSGYKEFVDENNEAIMRVVLGQPGTSKATPQGVGGKQAEVHSEVKDEIVKADADMICEGLNGTVAKWVTMWNYGPDVAPPTVFRVLEDPEDLDDTANRDVELDGIGIKRTKESIQQIYGDGYELDRLSAEQTAQNQLALAQAKPAGAGQQPPSNARPPEFSAAEEDAITRLAASLSDLTSPVLQAMADELKDKLEGVTTAEGARIALLDAFEAMPVEKMAQMIGLPLLAIRAAGEDIEA